MALLLVANIPLQSLYQDRYAVLVGTGLDRGILAICLGVLFVSLAAGGGNLAD